MLKRILFILLLLSCLLQGIRAQQKDSMQTMRQFISVCNTYKQQVPLYLSIAFSSSTNIITNSEDTAGFNADFYMLSNSAYMRFGEIEEIVNDSMALLVSSKMKRMLLYSNVQPIIAQLKAAMGMQIPKSAPGEWCKRFEINKKANGDKETIELLDRSKIYNTDIPKETIELLYNTSTQMPVEVSNVKRSLLAIGKGEYAQYQKEPLLVDKLINIDDAYYVVKEQKTVFTYKQLNHDQALSLSVKIADRVTKTSSPLNTIQYMPVAGYEEYVLTEE